MNDKSVSGLSKSPLCLLCRVVSQIPLQLVADLLARQLVRNKLATSPSTGKLRGSVCNGFWALRRTSDGRVVLHFSRLTRDLRLGALFPCS